MAEICVKCGKSLGWFNSKCNTDIGIMCYDCAYQYELDNQAKDIEHSGYGENSKKYAKIFKELVEEFEISMNKYIGDYISNISRDLENYYSVQDENYYSVKDSKFKGAIVQRLTENNIKADDSEISKVITILFYYRKCCVNHNWKEYDYHKGHRYYRCKNCGATYCQCPGESGPYD